MQTSQNIYKINNNMLPSEFVIANQPYKVIFVDDMPAGSVVR